MIKSKIYSQSKFYFTVQYEDVLRKIKNFNVSKAPQQSNTPTKILIENWEYYACYFHENAKYRLDKSLLFPLDLKLADVILVNKKKSKSSKDNYRPVSILSNIFKVYESCIYNQIHSYFHKILSSKQCGFCKDYNAQHCNCFNWKMEKKVLIMVVHLVLC